MKIQYTTPPIYSRSKEYAKQDRRVIYNYLRDELKLTFSELRNIWRLKDIIPVFTLSRYPDHLVDFRGCK